MTKANFKAWLEALPHLDSARQKARELLCDDPAALRALRRLPFRLEIELMLSTLASGSEAELSLEAILHEVAEALVQRANQSSADGSGLR